MQLLFLIGQEEDVAIFYCVGACKDKGIGFQVVGSAFTLKRDKQWANLLQRADQQSCLFKFTEHPCRLKIVKLEKKLRFSRVGVGCLGRNMPQMVTLSREIEEMRQFSTSLTKMNFMVELLFLTVAHRHMPSSRTKSNLTVVLKLGGQCEGYIGEARYRYRLLQLLNVLKRSTPTTGNMRLPEARYRHWTMATSSDLVNLAISSDVLVACASRIPFYELCLSGNAGKGLVTKGTQAVGVAKLGVLYGFQTGGGKGAIQSYEENKWKEELYEKEEMSGEGYIVPVNSHATLMKKVSISRSWILIDSTGEGNIVDVDKHAIMNRVQIHARDFRILDPLLMYPSTILRREKAIVLNLEHIKAIITAEEVLLRDPLDDNVIPIVEELRRRLTPVKSNGPGRGDMNEQQNGRNDIESGEEDDSPFEFRALEVALEAVCSFLDARTTELETAAYPALLELTSKISSHNLDRIRKLKNAMTRLIARVQKIRDELENLLDDEDDMLELSLSRKLAGASTLTGSGPLNLFPASPTVASKICRASRVSAITVHGDVNDVEEIEMLLEVYYIQIESTSNKLSTLREYIDDTEDYINILLEFFLSSGTVCLSIYSLVAGIFGMSIKYPWNENHGYMFKWVVIVTSIVCAAIYILIIFSARRKGLIGS
ncbi:hypothetical protein IFM89_038662 [Coptis chinensis]|uniref:Magnesium transporter n=1 Tax=Coptis chinensis TaxID=261450 RepID=A0A835I624_9MAGN|nr:hypothetical protein IFM89_038662 [Coptis chinensis]